MKKLRTFLLILFTLIALIYLNVVIPHTKNIQADTEDVTPTPTDIPATLTPTDSPTQTPSVTPGPTTSSSCSFSHDLTDAGNGNHTVDLYITTNNYKDYNQHVFVCVKKSDGSEATSYFQGIDSVTYSRPILVRIPGTYTATMYVKDASDSSYNCTGPVAATCSVDLSTDPSPSPTTTTPSGSCNFNASKQSYFDRDPHEMQIMHISQNFFSNNVHATVCVSEDNKDQAYNADIYGDINQYQFDHSSPVTVTADHTYTATMYLKNNADISHTCSGTVLSTCNTQTYFITPSVSPTISPTETVTPDDSNDSSDSCTSNCGDININVEQQQQQQQVLAATVAPAPSTKQLPSTGAQDVAIIPTLLSLVAAGWKLRKLA